MHRIRLLMMLGLAVLFGASAALADWAPADGHKMHFPQLPDEAGWDVNATQPLVLADDWMCSETGWVKDIHFWGSWRNGVEGQIVSFVLSIHDDIPASQSPTGYSMPGPTLWEQEIQVFKAVPIDPPTAEGWYDPSIQLFIPGDHQAYFQYNVFLPPEMWFWQEQGRVYWLNISAILQDPTTTQWGWKSTLNHWNDDAVWATWGNLSWIEMLEPPVFQQSLDLSFVITSTSDTCEYYKPRYQDYTPQGMPDFDQKQLNWNDQFGWTHCGPAAVANCLWWFDSKFEPNPVDPRPFGITPANDNFPLVPPYGQWDDHDPNNVQPLVNILAGLMQTNVTGSRGTWLQNLVTGTRQFITNAGMSTLFRDSLQPIPSFDFIKQQVLDCQDVILLLGFYENRGTTVCPIGWHYVTVAGVCTTATRICISDPYYDALEGNPPGVPPHAGTIHNDADNISGPHSQIQHDPYDITMTILPGGTMPVAVLPGYNLPAGDIPLFAGQNNPGIDPCPYTGSPLVTVIDAAYVICPDTVSVGCCMPDGSCIDTTAYWCGQLGGTPSPVGSQTCLGDNNGNGIDDACETVVTDTCEYYKPAYPDYVPVGMPDLDQKQDNWMFQGLWSHCGPVALANCLWWFDSKFETCTTPPPAVCDNYPLVTPFGAWDDHSSSNAMPFVDSLALYALTNLGVSGTNIFNLATGAQNWLNKVGLGTNYSIQVLPVDPANGFEYIRQQVLISQDVIILLGFYQDMGGGVCERIGGHYVTVAGVCTDPLDSALCISDPYFDANEGEPPAGSAHASSVHNDVRFVSGPHGTVHHDKYQVVPTTCTQVTGLPFQVELAGYPIDASSVLNFFGQNPYDPAIPPVPPQPGLIHTVLEFSLVICPVVPDTCLNQMPGDANNNGSIEIGDVVYLTAFLYTGGPAPSPLANGDANGDCHINIGDLICLNQYLAGQTDCLVDCTCVNPDLTQCCYDIRGNVDNDPLDQIDIGDLVYYVEYSFSGGPAPVCVEEADVNADLSYDIADIVYMVEYMFGSPSGPQPFDCP